MALRKRNYQGKAQRYFNEHIHDETDECLIWPFAKTGRGHGQVWMDGRSRYVHALACEMAHGPRPIGMIAVHGPCANPACFNPRHVSWGTHQQNNVADRIRDGIKPGGSGRGRKGETRKL